MHAQLDITEMLLKKMSVININKITFAHLKQRLFPQPATSPFLISFQYGELL